MDLSGLNKALDLVNGKKTYEEGKVYDLELSKIIADPNQPRKEFDEDKLAELAENIKLNGIIQPIIVREQEDHFVIVTGERRYRACQLLNEKTIKALVNKSYADDKVGYVQIAENLKRDDLKFYELADFIVARVNAGDSQSNIADSIGLQKSEISRYLSWQEAPEYLKASKDKFNSIRAFSDLAGLCDETNQEQVQEFLDTNDSITVRAVSDLKKKLTTSINDDAKTQEDSLDSIADNGNQELEPHQDEGLNTESIDNPSLHDSDDDIESEGFDDSSPFTSDISDDSQDDTSSEESSFTDDNYDDNSQDDQESQQEQDEDLNQDDVILDSQEQQSDKFKKPLIFGSVDGREAELLYKLCPSAEGMIKVKYEDGFEDEILAENFKINRICEA